MPDGQKPTPRPTEPTPNAEALLKRLFANGVIYLDEQYRQVTDHEGYNSLTALTDAEIAYLDTLLPRDPEPEQARILDKRKAES